MRTWAKQTGFTVVELMIIIVVIAILASIVAFSYQGTREQAQAASIASGLKTTAEAFEVWAIKEKRTTWWDDDTLTSQTSGHPPINLVIEETDLKYYLEEAPKVDGLTDAQWIYDNDGDAYNGCSASSTGVNIYIDNFNDPEVAQDVDAALDDGNINCGKVRYDSAGRLIYGLSKTAAMQ